MHELRAKFEYFNISYLVIQHVIQTLTGSWIGDFHKSRIWGLLSMDNTFIRLQDALEADRDGKAVLANGYSWDLINQKLNEQPWWDSELVGDGGIISSVRDFSKYLRAMIDQLLPLPKAAQRELKRARVIMNEESIFLSRAVGNMHLAGELPFTRIAT